jgi:hypothetical protein
VVLVWLALSLPSSRWLCRLITEPPLESCFLDPEAPTPALNKEGAGARVRACESCPCCPCGGGASGAGASAHVQGITMAR